MAPTTLEHYVLLIERGELPESWIWATIPGGVITGLVRRTENFARDMQREVEEGESPGDAAQLLGHAKEQARQAADSIDVDSLAGNEGASANLVYAVMQVNGEIIECGEAFLHTRNVIAWGLGQITFGEE